jgi:hypothetical protein
MKRLITVLAVMALLLLEPSGAWAQTRPGGPPGQGRDRQELEQRMRQGFGRMVQERLNLDPEQLEDLQSVMQSFREDRRSLNQEQNSLGRSLRMAAFEEMEGGEARTILNEMVRLQEVELELYRREQNELLTVLNPVQLVQFYRIREDMGARIQDLRRGRAGGRGGPPGGTREPGGGMGGSVDRGGYLPGVR